MRQLSRSQLFARAELGDITQSTKTGATSSSENFQFTLKLWFKLTQPGF
jgi:Tfp pilus assembly protein PilN